MSDQPVYFTIVGDYKSVVADSTVTGAGVAAITATPNTATNILDTVGKSPGNHTFNGQTYIGGAAGGFMSNGGKGADGAVWVYAYQV